MCVHVIHASDMPGVLAWADRRPLHTLVYADASLYCGGQLTAAGQAHIDAALAAVGAESLAGATRCARPLLFATAG
ncbi:hypothetical protein [Streptomyces sp. NBC_00932]|uniref:hypothetical protein n=1 Tax=Streptomyces sp. NBC_00932 TaxID=2903690 RepID=UPI00386D61A9|nr:hypothetical protein OG221_27970 [Streptomyces sp. NBC_00932]